MASHTENPLSCNSCTSLLNEIGSKKTISKEYFELLLSCMKEGAHIRINGESFETFKIDENGDETLKESLDECVAKQQKIIELKSTAVRKTLGKARWEGIWIENTDRLSKCRFALEYEKDGQTYQKILELGKNYIEDEYLFQENNVSITIKNRNGFVFYICTAPGSKKSRTWDYEDLYIEFAEQGKPPYTCYFLCPWLHREDDRWLNIYEGHLDLRLDHSGSDRGIDVDWSYPFGNWLGFYGKLFHSISGSGLKVFTAALGTVKAYDWPEGFTVWFKTKNTSEERITEAKDVSVALYDEPQLIIKKNGRQIATVWTTDEGSWDLGLNWKVEQSNLGHVKHVYRPPADDEGDKHDLYVSPYTIELYNYPHTFFRFGSNRGISALFTRDISPWL